MDKIEELLPDIDNFMRNVLAKENISIFAEKRRKYYVERLDIIKFDPPNLPPRPDGGLKKFPGAGGTESPVVNGSPAPSNKQSTVKSPVDTTFRNNAKNDRESVVSEENIYADMDDSPTEVDDVYLMPEQSTNNNTAANAQKSWSDSESGTSYESYGEEDQEDSNYMNIEDNGPNDDVPLPKIAKKKRKKKLGGELPIADLPNVTFRGELHYKGSWSWAKRYCVVSDNRLIMYKSEKDSRPLLKFVLFGYDVVYLEKEGRRSHVIRVSHPGCETHFFAADLKEIAELWISYLSTTGVTSEVPSSGDSAKLANSSKTSTLSSMQHSTSASNLSGSSEGGSGDGVVSMETQAKSNKTPDDKKSQVTDKKKKNIFDIIGTFSKKKGQKMKRQIITGDIPIDPHAVISGILDVFHETKTNNEWQTKFCMVKKGQLECFHDNLNDGVEFSLPLIGASIENAGKETKKELSIRLNMKNGEQVLLDTSDIIEQGKWLHVFIKCGENMLDDPSLLYENQEVGVPRKDEVEEEIYDEVDHTKMLSDSNNIKATGPAVTSSPLISNLIQRKSSGASDRIISHPIQRNSSGASDSVRVISHPIQRNSSSASDGSAPVISHPIQRNSSGASDSDGAPGNRPPLPMTDPPKRPLPGKLKSRLSMEEGGDLNLSEQISSAFPQMKSQIETGSKVKDTGSKAKVTISAKFTDVKVTQKTSTTEEDGVVKCHQGPTIAEDKELLEKTQNPILSELRKEKRQGSMDSATLKTQIDDLRSKLVGMKKQRSELRGKLLTARLTREKQQLQGKLQDLDKLIEESEKSVNKLQLLAQECGSNLSRNGSFQSSASGGSNNSSRSNSFRRPSEPPPELPTNTSRKEKTPRTSPTSAPMAISESQPRVKTSVKASINRLESSCKSTKSSTSTTTSATRTVSSCSTSRVGSKATNSSSTSASRSTVGRSGSSTANQSTGSSVGNTRKSSLTSPTKDSPRVGQTRIRTVHTTTTTTTTAGAGRGKKTTTTTTKSNEVNASKRAGVKDRLKLFEAMSEDSTC